MQARIGRILLWLPWVALLVLALAVGADLLRALAHEGREGLPLLERLINLVLRAIPLTLLLVALGLVIEVMEEEARTGHMTARVQRWLFWVPRVAVLTFAAFVSLFALDVFGAGYDFWETVVAFLIHLIPVFMMLVAIAIAWRWEWVGTLFFTGWAVWYIATARGFPLSVYLMMAGLPFVLGVLFLLNWRYRAEVRAAVGR